MITFGCFVVKLKQLKNKGKQRKKFEFDDFLDSLILFMFYAKSKLAQLTKDKRERFVQQLVISYNINLIKG